MDQGKSLTLIQTGFAELGVKESQDLEEWIKANPDILGSELLLLTSEYDRFDKSCVPTDCRIIRIVVARDPEPGRVRRQYMGGAFQRVSLSTFDVRLNEIHSGNIQSTNHIIDCHSLLWDLPRYAPGLLSSGGWEGSQNVQLT